MRTSGEDSSIVLPINNWIVSIFALHLNHKYIYQEMMR
jgi:hypothetical protein